MTALEVAIALLVVAVLVVVVATRLRRSREQRAPWRLVEDSDGEIVHVFGCRPGHERLEIGSAPPEEAGALRAEGERRIAALNAGRRV